MESKTREELMQASAIWIKENLDIVPDELKILFARYILENDAAANPRD